MTKSTGIGRGGQRPGAGRKKAEKPVLERPQVPVAGATVHDVEALARSYTVLAIETLATIAASGEKEAARVVAANSLLERGHGKAGGAVQDGKKAQRQATAEKAATGGNKFAVRSGPRLAVNNA